MGQWILDEFMKLFDSVLGWIVSSLGGLWGGLINILLEALIEGVRQTLADIVHALLGGLVTEVTEGINAVQWIPEWVKYGLTTFAANIGEALGTIADGAITMTAEGAAAILGVTNAQEIYMNNLQSSLDTQLNAMLQRIEASQTEDVRITEEVAAEFTSSLSRTVTGAYQEAVAFLQSSQIGISGQMEGAASWAKNTLAASLLGIQETGRVAIDMIDKDMAGVSTYLTEIAIKEPERFLQSIENTIVIPAANAEAMAWAISSATEMDIEQIKVGVKQTIIAMNELAVEMNIPPQFKEGIQ